MQPSSFKPPKALFPVKVIRCSQPSQMSSNKDNLVRRRYTFCPERSLITPCTGRAPIYIRPVKIRRQKKLKAKKKQCEKHGGKYLAVITIGSNCAMKRGVVTRVIHGPINDASFSISTKRNYDRIKPLNQLTEPIILRVELRERKTKIPNSVPVLSHINRAKIEYQPPIPITSTPHTISLDSSRSTTPKLTWPTPQHSLTYDQSLFTNEIGISYSDGNQDPKLPSNFEMCDECFWRANESYFY